MITWKLRKQPSGALGAEGVLLSGKLAQGPLCPLLHRAPESLLELGRGGLAGAEGREGEASVPLTRLSFQMIESNDISGEKMRMKETVEGEWPLGRMRCGAMGKGWAVLPLSWVPLCSASSADW